MRVYHVLGRELAERSGQHPIFGLLGDANLAPIAVAVDAGARFVAARHESGAIAMATGYARATGEVAIATTTRGPGLTNAATALVSAVGDRIPMVYVLGGNPAAGPQDNQALDERQVVAPTGAEWIQLLEPDQTSATVARAFDLARDRRLPVILHVPSDVLDAAAPTQRRAAPPRVFAPAPEPSTDAIREACRVLGDARRPVILGGRGAQDRAVARGLRGLARRSGALLATSLPASGLFYGDPFSIGVLGGYALPRTVELMHEADVVLAVGTSLTRYTTSDGTLFPQAHLIRVDTDPSAFELRQASSSTAVAGDADDVVMAMLRDLPERRDPGYRTRAVRALISGDERRP